MKKPTKVQKREKTPAMAAWMTRRMRKMRKAGRQAGVSTVITAGDGARQGPERHPFCILSCCNLRAYSPSTGLRHGSLAHPEDTQP